MIMCGVCGYIWKHDDGVEKFLLTAIFLCCCQCGTEIELPPKDGAEKGKTECPKTTRSSLSTSPPRVRQCGEWRDGSGAEDTQ